MLELPKDSQVRKTLEDKDFRHFAKQLAYAWSDYYTNVSKNPNDPSLIMKWAEVETILASARFWNIIGASFAYDVSAWLQAAEFVNNVPAPVREEYDQKYLVRDTYRDSLKYGTPKKYCYEQYFIYLEVCKALGADSSVEDED